MRKIAAILALVIFASCAQEQEDYVTLKGTLINPTQGDIILQGRDLRKVITVNADGSFTDTIKVTAGVHNLIYNKQRTALFLKNGYDLTLSFKEERFVKGIRFSGIGKETNDYMEKKKAFFESEKANPKTYYKMNEEDFTKALSETKLQLEKLSNNAPKVDSIILKGDIKNNNLFLRYIDKSYKKAHANLIRLAKGTESPKFVDYENYAGGTTSLDDFKGKYVYIDIWATWCAPCKQEIPFLKTLEEKFHGKNIEFVSISLDKKPAYETWRNMIKERNMGGVQLIADKDFTSKFVKDYGISAIPRFVLLDTEGKIIDADTSRPSNPKTGELLNYLLN